MLSQPSWPFVVPIPSRSSCRWSELETLSRKKMTSPRESRQPNNRKTNKKSQINVTDNGVYIHTPYLHQYYLTLQRSNCNVVNYVTKPQNCLRHSFWRVGSTDSQTLVFNSTADVRSMNSRTSSSNTPQTEGDGIPSMAPRPVELYTQIQSFFIIYFYHKEHNDRRSSGNLVQSIRSMAEYCVSVILFINIIS